MAAERDADHLVVELDSVHTLTGRRYDDDIVDGTGLLIRRVTTWEYDCTCGELGMGRWSDDAMRHVAAVRGRGAA